MPCERKPMRYGHSEGHTEVCFDDTGRYIVTCGNDGDVRIWESLDDDDPKFITVGEKAYSLALKVRLFYQIAAFRLLSKLINRSM
uniref:Uncharacterized protein n=1 Tax=Poecilia formosa TaxID=48698 RepID=A0A096MDW6_POEFO